MTTKNAILLFLSLFVLFSCNNQDEFFDKEGMSVYRPKRVFDKESSICNPFGGYENTGINNGIVGTLYDGSQFAFNNVHDYFSKAPIVSRNILFSHIEVPTRAFDRGFVQNNGTVLMNAQGNTLYEYFAVNFDGRITLSPTDLEGTYEFAMLADDGASFSLNLFNNWQTVAAFDQVTPTRMICGEPLVNFERDHAVAFNLRYFQGPRLHIAITLMWRKVPDPQTRTLDPLCNHLGNELFFDSSTNPSTPQAAYQDLLNRGWKVLKPSNYLLPENIGTNPCSDEGGGEEDYCISEKISNPSSSEISLGNLGAIENSIDITVNGQIFTDFDYSSGTNKVLLRNLNMSSVTEVEISYCGNHL